MQVFDFEIPVIGRRQREPTSRHAGLVGTGNDQTVSVGALMNADGSRLATFHVLTPDRHHLRQGDVSDQILAMVNVDFKTFHERSPDGMAVTQLMDSSAGMPYLRRNPAFLQASRGSFPNSQRLLAEGQPFSPRQRAWKKRSATLAMSFPTRNILAWSLILAFSSPGSMLGSGSPPSPRDEFRRCTGAHFLSPASDDRSPDRRNASTGRPVTIRIRRHSRRPL